MSALIGFFTGGWGLVLGIWKRIAPYLTVRNLLILAGILAFAYAQYKFYNWAEDNGMEKQAKIDKKEIDRLTTERDHIQLQYDAFSGAFYTWVYRSELARLNLAKENQQTVEKIETDLATARKRLKKLQGLRNEISTYVPAAADFDLPTGFVRLFNLSLEGEAAQQAGSPESDFLPGGGLFAPGAPSGVALSTLAEVAVDNNAECVYRGQVIAQWQYWYKTSKEQFERAQRSSIEAIPNAPASGTPPPGAASATSPTPGPEG